MSNIVPHNELCLSSCPTTSQIDEGLDTFYWCPDELYNEIYDLLSTLFHGFRQDTEAKLYYETTSTLDYRLLEWMQYQQVVLSSDSLSLKLHFRTSFNSSKMLGVNSAPNAKSLIYPLPLFDLKHRPPRLPFLGDT